MNTDVILDFIVDYYLWFIIGGGILLLAIIGFIADKKKLFKKNNDKNKNNVQDSTLQDSSDEVINTEDSDDNSFILESTSNEVTPKVNVDKEVNMGDSLNNNFPDEMDSQTSYFDEHINDNKIVNAENNESIEKNDIIDKNIYMGNSNDVTVEYEQLTNSTEDNANKVGEKINESIDENNSNESINFDEPIVIFDNDIKDELKYIDNLEINNQKENDEYQTITENDNNIGDISFKDDKADDIEVINIKDGTDNKESNEPVTTEQLIDLNDREDESLNISYSKLKEIVEEIISEQACEQKNEDNINNVQNISTFKDSILNISQDIKPNIEPNLDQNAVEKIKQLDDDEDDVWKF